MSRICPFSGCGRRIKPEMFSCRDHWFRLDAQQQAEIWSAYRGWQRGLVDGDELRLRQEVVIAQVEGRGP